ncbi:MAG: hypothetical protein GY861_05820 [bacterium]|nr:hypothetical protein [bacterium]
MSKCIYDVCGCNNTESSHYMRDVCILDDGEPCGACDLKPKCYFGDQGVCDRPDSSYFGHEISTLFCDKCLSE